MVLYFDVTEIEKEKLYIVLPYFLWNKALNWYLNLTEPEQKVYAIETQKRFYKMKNNSNFGGGYLTSSKFKDVIYNNN